MSESKSDTGPEPTKRPWTQECLLVTDADGNTVAHCTRWEGHHRNRPAGQIAEANAEFIVRAVNSHQELLDALKETLRQCDIERVMRAQSNGFQGDVSDLDRRFDPPLYIAEARAAIAKAEWKS